MGAAVQFLDVGMIAGGGEHARDDPTLVGHPHVLRETELLDPIRHRAPPFG
jgi:hypothetical protein